jgi:hypothetical protein
MIRAANIAQILPGDRPGCRSTASQTTTLTTDVDEYHRVNDERYKYFKTDLPTSALIGEKRLAHEELTEIECMAVIPTERFKPRTKASGF